MIQKLSGELKQVAVNRVTADVETFWGSPAVSDGRMILRSSKNLYCLADKSETVKPEEIVVAKVEEVPAPEGEGGNQKLTFYLSGRFDLPRGRREDSSPRAAAVLVCQRGSPNGVPRARLWRSDLSSASVSTPLTCRVH